VSGIGEKLAENIVTIVLRTVLENRKQLSTAWAKRHISKVPLLSEFRMLKSFDNSAVHPEAMQLSKKWPKT
jgi:transcriptional accessory protein Tex/SPT6